MKATTLKTDELRFVRRLTELTPLRDNILAEREVIDEKPFSKITSFITSRPIQKELACYYLLHNKVVDTTKVFSAEDIKDIYFHSHPVYNGFHDVEYPIYVILLGKELYNGQMINILNIFVDNFLRNPKSLALIFVYQGTKQEFDFKYMNTQERGVLNAGSIIQTDKVTSSMTGTKTTRSKKTTKQNQDQDSTYFNKNWVE